VGGGLLDYIDGVEWPSNSQILSVYNRRIIPLLVNSKGEITTFKDSGINQEKYVEDFKKSGYYKQPLKLIYKILPNDQEKDEAIGYIIPVNGFGLWDAIYGYIALKPDGNSIIGISWYDQKETPGLGAVITEWDWQEQFPGKVLFQPSADGQTDFKTAPIGITVVRGKVAEVFGDTPRSENSVNGIAGATLTGNGVNEAYKQVLGPYRPFLIKLHDSYKESDKESDGK
jgi:Na+-transporting NADH:ubiquinone oxidoreductase subunit C